MKQKKVVLIAIGVILCIVLYSFFAVPAIEKRMWVLSYAQQAEPMLLVVAHNEAYDLSDHDSPLYQFSKPIELTMEADGGHLLLTDTTNGKTYEGTYSVASRGVPIRQRYDVVINGVEGTANISSTLGRTLFVSIGEYYLHFEVR